MLLLSAIAARAMNSHTVPRKLLDQFAYDDPVTRQRRLWRYQKARRPYPKASPESATVIDTHFADPRNPTKEFEIETRLNREIEQPVNEYIEQLGYRTFAFNLSYVRQLSAYVYLLFVRSKARQKATQQQIDITVHSIRSLLADEEKMGRVAERWTTTALQRRKKLDRPFKISDVRIVLETLLADQLSPDHLQHSYSESVERAMSSVDESLSTARWGVLQTTPDNPFVIGDAPVVTWAKDDNGYPSYGEGFDRPNVEAFLPISPIACLHIVPNVVRTKRVIPPEPMEINAAQASFATHACYTNIQSQSLDGVLQANFGRSVIGVTAFSLFRRD